MAKYRPYSRRVLRASYLQWARAHRKMLVLQGALALGLLVLLVVVVHLIVFLIPRLEPVRWYAVGFSHAALLAYVIHVINSTVLAQDREAIHHVRGAWGEEFTRDQLGRATRKKLIWGSVDSITLQSGDIDHLVVTRSGGLVMIDSKWRTRADFADHQAMVRAAKKARLRADAVVHTVVRAERGGHRAQGRSVRVRPVVVLWGAGQREVPEGAQIDGVDFIGGPRLCDWITSLDGDPVDQAAGKELLTKIEAFRASSWPTQAGRAPAAGLKAARSRA